MSCGYLYELCEEGGNLYHVLFQTREDFSKNTINIKLQLWFHGFSSVFFLKFLLDLREYK